MADFDFVGEAYTARSIYQDDQELINLYPEIDANRGPDRRGVVALYPTPGLVNILTFPDAAEVRGLYVVSGSTILMAVCGASVYSVSTGFVATLVGTLATNNGPVSMADNGLVVMIVDGNSRYVYNLTTGYFTNLTTATFTGTIAGTTLTVSAITAGLIGLNQVVVGAGVAVGTVVTAFGTGVGLTGTYVVSLASGVGPEAMTMADGAFNGGSQVAIVDNFFVYANPNTTAWGASNALSASSQPLSQSFKDGSPDFLVSLVVDKREVYLLGERTYEVWVDQGSFPFPFARLPGTSAQHGCVAPYSIARLGNSFAWLARDTRGQGIVYQMDGYVPKRISTYAVENAITGYPIISDARAYSYQQGGHEFYVVTFPSADITWVYDFTSGMWHKRLWRDNLNVLHRHRGNCAATFSNRVVLGDWQNGQLYSLNLSAYDDVGAPIYRLRRCPHLTESLNRVNHKELQIQFQPGVGLSVGQGVTPQAMLQWSDDGGSTWSNEHWTSVGAIGLYKARAMWRRLGVARDRIYQVAMTDPVNWVIISANLLAVKEAH